MGLVAVSDKVNAGTTDDDPNGMTAFTQNAGESVNPGNLPRDSWKAGEGLGQEVVSVEFDSDTRKASIWAHVSGSKQRVSAL